MMKRLHVLLACTLTVAPPALSQPAPADPAFACQPGARLDYPARRAIADRGILLSLQSATSPFGDPSVLPQPVSAEMMAQLAEHERQDAAEKTEALARLAALPPVERDLTLLAALQRVLAGDRPVTLMVTQTDARFLPLYLDVLDRHGLAAQAAAIRAALAIFGPEITDPRLRANLWINPRNFEMNAPLDLALQPIDAGFLPLAPAIQATAEALAQSDPQLSAAIAAEAGAVDEMAHLRWIAGQILGCAGDWNAGIDRADPFAALPAPQHDLAVLEIFMDEVMNGGTQQFFNNSSGGLAPEVHEILQRVGLPGHATALKQAMEMLGDPYPRDRRMRGAVMDGFDEAQDEALNAPTGIMDDGEIYMAMLKIARESGLMAQ